MGFFFGRGTTDSGRGRSTAAAIGSHAVLGGPLLLDPGQPGDSIGLAMGCFWGAEKLFWDLPGVITTAVGYQGGAVDDPTYEQVCSGRTGHAETVRVSYRPEEVPLAEILALFWENHDPTQSDRQGNDIGTQYRSAIFAPDEDSLQEALRSAEIYCGELAAAGLGRITTQIVLDTDLPFQLAEPYHQQYLHKHPNGYQCHSNTGIRFPREPGRAREQASS